MATKLGTSGNDTINAGNGGDTVVGFEGNDLLTGGSAGDWILGNQGDDTIAAGDGNDTVVGGQNNDLLFGQMGNDFIYGNEGDDIASGGMGADTIIGGQGNDVLYGNEGNDLIFGNEGNDSLYGGDGTDTVAYSSSIVTVTTVSGGYQVSSGEGTDFVASDVEQLITGYGTANQTIHAIADMVHSDPTPPPFVPSTDFAVNTQLPASDRNASGNFDNGDGTTPSTGFEIVTNHDTHLHIATRVDYRHGDTIQPVSSTHDGTSLVNVYNVNHGAQSTANGSFDNNANRGASNTQLDFGADDGRSLADILAGGNHIYRLEDTDGSAAVSGTLQEAHLSSDGHGLDWATVVGGTPTFTDDTGNGQHSANSYNNQVFSGVPVASLTAGTEWTNRYWETNSDSVVVASITNDVHLV